MKLLKQKLIWLTFGLVVFAGQATAQNKSFDQSVLSVDGKKAYEALLKVNLFAIGPIGYGASTPAGKESLDILIGEDLAVSALKSLIGEATPEGGLYAVLGLKTLKCECLDDEVKKFNDRTFSERKRWGRGVVASENVSRMSGCIAFEEKRSDVLERIIKGEYDNWINSRRVNRWSKEKGR